MAHLLPSGGPTGPGKVSEYTYGWPSRLTLTELPAKLDAVTKLMDKLAEDLGSATLQSHGKSCP